MACLFGLNATQPQTPAKTLLRVSPEASHHFTSIRRHQLLPRARPRPARTLVSAASTTWLCSVLAFFTGSRSKKACPPKKKKSLCAGWAGPGHSLRGPWRPCPRGRSPSPCETALARGRSRRCAPARGGAEKEGHARQDVRMHEHIMPLSEEPQSGEIEDEHGDGVASPSYDSSCLCAWSTAVAAEWRQNKTFSRSPLFPPR